MSEILTDLHVLIEVAGILFILSLVFLAFLLLGGWLERCRDRARFARALRKQQQEWSHTYRP